MSDLAAARRVVVKVGSALVVDPATGAADARWLASLAADLGRMAGRGQRLLVVSSGAVALGRRRLALKRRDLTLPEKQAAAAAGQSLLMRAWEEALAPVGLTAAQVLLTPADTEVRRRYLNARATLETLFELSVTPIVNENDTVATDEIRYGDNDRLAARVAQMVGADLLVLLSDVDGLYTADPRRDPAAAHIPVVTALTPQIEAMAGGAHEGTGGMATKVAAARIATSCGIPLVLMSGTAPELVLDALAGQPVGTTFAAGPNRMEGRKRWLAFSGQVGGKLSLDAGAVKAVREQGKSLLPAGIRKVAGDFDPGALVALLDPEGHEVARGLVNYSSDELVRIRGHHSAEIEGVLGYKHYDEAIHRNNLVTT